MRHQNSILVTLLISVLCLGLAFSKVHPHRRSSLPTLYEYYTTGGIHSGLKADSVSAFVMPIEYYHF